MDKHGGDNILDPVKGIDSSGGSDFSKPEGPERLEEGVQHGTDNPRRLCNLD